MKRSQLFARLFFFFFTLLFIAGTYLSARETITVSTVVWAAVLGLGMGGFLLLLEGCFRKFHLLSFNTTLLGLFFGYLMGLALLAIFHTLLSLTPQVLNENLISFVQAVLFLSGLYLGVMMTHRASYELLFSIPFLRFSKGQGGGKELLLDSSVLADERLVDLAASGLLDGRLTVPRFLLKELYELEESKDEGVQAKGRLCLETLKKLERLPDLNLTYQESDFPSLKDPLQKLFKLAQLLNATIFSADAKCLPIEGVRIIHLNTIAAALKPLMQRGEYLAVKIQRQGKEERQGVGYLEDGTMIVVNGAGDYIGKTIKACVLSVKQTSTGRMIFCNVAEEMVLLA